MQVTVTSVSTIPPPPDLPHSHVCHLCNAVLHLPMFTTYAMLLPLTQFGNCSGEPFPKGGLLRSGSYCGAALHGRYLMVPASAQLRVLPERKDGGHPALCNAPPQWLRMRHQSHQSHQRKRSSFHRAGETLNLLRVEPNINERE